MLLAYTLLFPLCCLEPAVPPSGTREAGDRQQFRCRGVETWFSAVFSLDQLPFCVIREA